MAYNNNIPLANQRIKDTQEPIRENFEQLDTYTQVNHEALNSPDAGKHKFVTLTNQAAAPTTEANEINIFNAVVNGVQQLHLKKGGGTAIPFTQGAGSESGWSYLPSGFKLWWLRTGAVTTPSTTVTYTAAIASFPGFTQSPFVLIQPVFTPNTFLLTNNTAASVTFNAQSNGTAMLFAIGI